MQPTVYMDWNATAPVLPAARAAMLAALEDCGNPSSVHGFGRRARKRVEDARSALAALVGAKVENVVFTASGTEANALMLANRGERRLIVSAIEHDSVLKPALAAGAGTIDVGRDGVADLDHLKSLLAADARPALVSLMLANNETGVIQPVAEAAGIAHAHGALLHVDAAQAVGRVPVALDALGADFVTVSGHKFGAPQGVGALIAAGAAPQIVPLLQGGGQERSRRAGTENVPAIAGLGAAVAALEPMEAGEIGTLRDALERRLVASDPSATVFGGSARRLPNTSCFAAGEKSAETLVMALDLAGIAVSAGSACSSGKVKPSHVVSAMGFDRETASRAIRVSLGRGSTAEDIDAFFLAWQRIQAPRQMTAAA
ncbi:MAG TPA: cysteine desulfurase family protein [Dongiaceae bacterium]|nr:cysteine desulfurase family protein [Dongiaceae bacterium]